MKIISKNYIIFFLSVFLFLVSLISLMLIYISLKSQDEPVTSPIEVSLPVIDWQKYSSLSKTYPDDKLENRN